MTPYGRFSKNYFCTGMKKLRGSAILMIIAILGITGFQLYWLKNNYDREKQSLELKTRAAFRETILRLQSSKLKLEKIVLSMDSISAGKGEVISKKAKWKGFDRPIPPNTPAISILNLIQEKMRDSLLFDSRDKKRYVFSVTGDTLRRSVTDTTGKFKGRIRSVNLSHKWDSIVSQKVEEVHVDKAVGSGGRIVTIEYGGQPGEKLPATIDSSSHYGSEASNPRNHLPPVPVRADVTMERPEQEGNSILRLLFDIDSLSLKDSVTLDEINAGYKDRLKTERINVGFRVARIDSTQVPPPDAVTIGFSRPASYDLTLTSTFPYFLERLKLPILFSLLLVGITITSFVLLYRTLLRQQRLAILKNEFISNITHELKTPIATVGVAIEALKNFNAIDDPARTREYLDISQQELQRLNLLVDKVLKLSMFEKKEIELKYEEIDLKDLVAEVVASMRLQVEKFGARVMVRTAGDTTLKADRLHLLSVIFNLLDNALKYSKDAPEINIELKEEPGKLVLVIADNGIGIPPEFKEKIFDKFFRVPHGDTHNAKGYGLGLSYTAHVVRKHQGKIELTSEPGQGSQFIITLPKTPAPGTAH